MLLERYTLVIFLILFVGIMGMLSFGSPRLNMDRSTLANYRWTDIDAGVICYVMPGEALDCLPISETRLEVAP